MTTPLIPRQYDVTPNRQGRIHLPVPPARAVLRIVAVLTVLAILAVALMRADRMQQERDEARRQVVSVQTELATAQQEMATAQRSLSDVSAKLVTANGRADQAATDLAVLRTRLTRVTTAMLDLDTCVGGLSKALIKALTGDVAGQHAELVTVKPECDAGLQTAVDLADEDLAAESSATT